MTPTIAELDALGAAHPRLSLFFSFGRLHVERAPYCECCGEPYGDAGNCACFPAGCVVDAAPAMAWLQHEHEKREKNGGV